MPGGIGPVPPQSRKPACNMNAERDLPANASERDIFFHLSHWRVFYITARRLLYFSDTQHSPVVGILDRLTRKHGLTYLQETLYLDPHRCFFGGYRVELPEIIVKPLLVALRLEGVAISQKFEADVASAPESEKG